MSQGLQVFNAAGGLEVDTSTFIYKEIDISSVTASGSLTVAVPAGATLVVVPTVDYSQSGTNAAPEVVINGGTISYTYMSGGSYNSKIRVALL